MTHLRITLTVLDRPQSECFSSLTYVYVYRLTEIQELTPTTDVADILSWVSEMYATEIRRSSVS